MTSSDKLIERCIKWGFLTFSLGTGVEDWFSESAFEFFSKVCPQHMSEIYKTSNHNSNKNIVNRNSSQKSF